MCVISTEYHYFVFNVENHYVAFRMTFITLRLLSSGLQHLFRSTANRLFSRKLRIEVSLVSERATSMYIQVAVA